MFENSQNSIDNYGTLIVVMGLPGSGKSTYLKSLKDDNPSYSSYDDFQGDAYNDDADPRLSKYFGSLIADLKQGRTAIVSDIRYCDPGELNLFLSLVLNAAPSILLSLKYFENSPELCKQNILKRARKDRVEQELKLVDTLTKVYAIPNLEKLSVYDPTGS